MQYRTTPSEFWKDLDLVIFEPREDGRVTLSYVVDNKELVHDDPFLEDLLKSNEGLRV